MIAYIFRFFKPCRRTGRILASDTEAGDTSHDNKIPQHAPRRHLQGHRGHQRASSNEERGKKQTGTSRVHIGEETHDEDAYDGTDEKRIADSGLHLRGIAIFAQQMLEDDIGWICQVVLEAIIEVGEVLSPWLVVHVG